MNQCTNCNVWIEDGTCPLCLQYMPEEMLDRKVNRYPIYQPTNQRVRNAFFLRLMIFISVVILSASLLINIFLTPQFFWVYYVAAAIFYLLVAINHTIISSAHMGAKIVYQVISLTGLVIVIDILSGFWRWSVNFIVPFLIITATLVTTIIIVKKRMHWNEYVGFILTLILLGFLPIGIFFTGVSTIFWPSIITSVYASLTFLGFWLFSYKIFKEELIRRFHF